ncbi:hypothetical protein Cpir12675_002686 [Ceratocystis pirilliformis]|uniref:JAB1/MPN/MOV34 metalloenzyme domain-containing protein n=1 Tax=Ceratocystis pirilliformis TaxID=259994 RepID=A0ABR3Z7S9_9PEZI
MAVPLISSQKSTDLQLSIHPIVLLSISDHIARHTLRPMAQPPLPLVGLLMGFQEGCKVSINRTFDIAVKSSLENVPGECHIDNEVLSFCDQLQSHTHVVGYYTILPRSGPDHGVLAMHEKLSRKFPDRDLLLLAFHPDEDIGRTNILPITIYESRLLTSAGVSVNARDNDVVLSGTDEVAPAITAAAPMQRQFYEIPQYTVVTDDAEMIGMDFVAAGGGNAKAVTKADNDDVKSNTQNTLVEAKDTANKDKDMEKEKGKGKEADIGKDAALQLTRDEEDVIAALKTKANAIRMLQARVKLLASYLSSLPESFVSTGIVPTDIPSANSTPDHNILRQIQAAVVRLGLIVPSDVDAFSAELANEETSIATVALINDMVQAAYDSHLANRDFVAADTPSASSMGRGKKGLAVQGNTSLSTGVSRGRGAGRDLAVHMRD